MSNNTLLLGLATNGSSALNFQIPSINIKLDRTNYSLWRSTVLSALATFDLDEFVLAPNPPAETVPVATAAPPAGAAPINEAPNPEFELWKKRDAFVLLWLKSTLSERSLAIVARSMTSQEAWSAIDKTFQPKQRPDACP